MALALMARSHSWKRSSEGSDTTNERRSVQSLSPFSQQSDCAVGVSDEAHNRTQANSIEGIEKTMFTKHSTIVKMSIQPDPTLVFSW